MTFFWDTSYTLDVLELCYVYLLQGNKKATQAYRYTLFSKFSGGLSVRQLMYRRRYRFFFLVYVKLGQTPRTAYLHRVKNPSSEMRNAGIRTPELLSDKATGVDVFLHLCNIISKYSSSLAETCFGGK